MTVSIGEPVPDFSASATGDNTITLSQLRGRQVVIYFYPKASTPGCTTEGGDFRDEVLPLQGVAGSHVTDDRKGGRFCRRQLRVQ